MAMFVVTASAVTACQSSGTAPEPTLTMTPPSPTPTATTSEDAVLAVYRDLYPAGQRAERAYPAERKAILEHVATQPLLNRMLRGIAALRATHRVTWGNPEHHPFDVRIERDRAILHDCQDARKGGQADDRTGKRLTHGTSRIHLVATLTKGADGAWRVSKVEQVKEPCSPTA
ncbi:hypothetical protein [Microbispora triticiradicis]|uniref:hypothetical protein n=1 Tax=Microbispora triticiradicis TaxID=2200763 RepID=UPI001AD72C48|nr:hypothetical protein [Microbispora triticiradicis]MBO4269073.1 hypothetical protein [Microbispora triticiradicis]